MARGGVTATSCSEPLRRWWVGGGRALPRAVETVVVTFEERRCVVIRAGRRVAYAAPAMTALVAALNGTGARVAAVDYCDTLGG